MYQPWASGRHMMQKFSFKNINYNLAYQCQKDDPDPNATMWWDWICIGPAMVDKPEIVIDMENATITGSEQTGKTPEQYVLENVAKMNAYLTAYFGGTLPQTWVEKVEAVIQNLSVSMASGIPQIVLESSRDWGANPPKNKWMANRTGYTGNFGVGLFSAWCAANGWDVAALSAEYDALP